MTVQDRLQPHSQLSLPAPHTNGSLGEGVCMFLLPCCSSKIPPLSPSKDWNAAHEVDKGAAM